MSKFGFKLTRNVATIADISPPVVAPGQSISYLENKSSGDVLGVVLASDNVGVTGYRFTATGTTTSSDTFFSIGSTGIVTMTLLGAAGASNDYETGSNTFIHGVQARDAAGNWSPSVNVTFNVLDVADSSANMLIGMNAGSSGDYVTNQPFANLLRNMRLWKRQDDSSDSVWVSQSQGQITGATGTHWFSSVVITPEAGLATQTLKFQNPSGNLIAITGSAGDPGSGAFKTDATLDVPYTATGFIYIHAKGNVSGTMALLQAGHEASYASGNEFTTAFISFHTGLGTKALRFMDWSATNTTFDSTWSDRTVTTKISFQASGGIQVPYELQIDACNRIGCDLWVNIPARASTTTFSPQLASLVFASLNSSHKVYVERGNEIWNTFSVFFMQTEWIRRFGHTRFNYTCNGTTTFTKTAHGFSNDQRFQSFANPTTTALGVNQDTRLANANWATATGYTAGQFKYGPDTAEYVCLTSHTSGTFATDLAAGKWVSTGWYPLYFGTIVYVKVLTADTFELWTLPGGTGTKLGSPPAITSMIGLLSDEGGVIADEAAALNTQYAQLCLADWTAFDTVFGGTSRVVATLGSQAAGATTWTGGRLAVTGVAARCNHVHIAPYHNGHVWGGKVVPAAGKITPSFFASSGGTGHCTVYTAGSTPTMTQRKAGTGTGFQTRLSPMTVSSLTSSNDRSWRQGSDITIADGTYKVYMDFVDPDGFTWTVFNTVVVGSGQPTVDFVDTDANQQLRDLWNIDSGTGDLKFIQDHQTAIAASSNPAITLINYEGGSHQDYYPPDGSGLDTWYRAHRESSTYADTLKHYYSIMAAAGIKLHMHYMDVSGQTAGLLDTPWRIASSYTDTADNRYVALASFGGLVPVNTLVDFGTVSGAAFSSAPSYPATIATFSNPALTYTVLPRSTIEDGVYSIASNVLSLTASGSINFAAPATQNVWIRATDGHTDAFFQVTYNTGSAWYSASKQVAWSKNADSTPAALNVIGGTAITATTAATVVSDGWDLNGVAWYDSGYGASPIPYTDSPLFVIAARPDGDTATFQNLIKWGNGPYVNFYPVGGSQLGIDSSVASGSFTYTSALTAFWLWYDNANLKYYYGTNQTIINTGGTSYSSQGSAAFPGYLLLGSGTSSWVVAAFEVAPAANITAALALVQALQTEVGI